MVTVRLDDSTVRSLEDILDAERFPTQSDFIREAIRRMVREERRNRVRAEAQRLAADPDDAARASELAHIGIEEFADRLEKADRGEL